MRVNIIDLEMDKKRTFMYIKKTNGFGKWAQNVNFQREQHITQKRKIINKSGKQMDWSFPSAVG